jgi:glycosyltransferase involved in cell wall biosynthesis
VPLVSISDSQRAPVAFARWMRTVHHGLPLGELRLHARPGEYLAFLGRVAPEKGLDRAIAIAKQAGLPLRIAAKIDPADRAYYEQQIRPLLDHPLIEFLGEIGGRAKNDFLGGARAVLFPIDWPEPFGLVMIEAMACGTPVIAFSRGSVPEIMHDGVSGYVVNDVAGAVKAIERIDRIDRVACRAYFERRFSAAAMADAYVGVYNRLLASPTRGRAFHALETPTPVAS